MAVDRSRRARGEWGEQRAAVYLEQLGFAIVDRNWRPHGAGVRGELDLIARRDDLVVVCEVKARRSGAFGGAVAAVTPAKQQRIRELALLWLDAAAPGDVDLRFDVIAIDGTDLTHYDAAF